MTEKNTWTWTLLAATLAVTLAALGLLISILSPATAPAVTTGLLLGSLGFTAAAFASVALRLRRLELENEGLIEEISQELDRVNDKFEVFSDALAEPRALTPEEAANTPMRRVMVK